MIKLKSLIKESKLQKLDLSKSQSGIAFTTTPDMIKFTDPYEYKFVDGIWYTRKREGYGSDGKWVDMSKKISAEDHIKAIDILLNKVYRVKTSDLKKSETSNDTQETPNNKQETPISQDLGSKYENPVKPDLGIKRDTLGYIISGKSAIYGKTFTMRSNMKDAGIVILKQIDQDEIDRKTGKIDHSFVDVVTTLWPEDAKYYQIGDIKTITMPAERGAYSKQEDPNNGRKFTYLYIVGTNGYKGWIPSNVVKINS